MKLSWLGRAFSSAGGKAALVLLAAGLLLGQNAVAGIKDTKHNLGTGGTGSNHMTTGTAEICVFCHTPHAADTTAAVPLWNKHLGASSSYTTYNSLGTSSLDGAVVPVGSVSIACLSCHDGSQAMSVMINQPGSDGINGGGAVLSGTWAAGGRVSASGTLTGYALLGLDLTNDHPIGIQYGGGPASGVTPTTATTYLTKDADFTSTAGSQINGKSVWWVNTSATGSTSGREKTDMQLYTRTNASNSTNTAQLAGDQPYVECASCHDPHSSTNATFLRISNSGSAVCLACHIK